MTRPAEKVGGIILAAGESRRFGTQKLLAPLAGLPLVQHVIDAANGSTLARVLLVVGADADAVLAAARLGRALAVRNADHRSGQASSLRAGIGALPDEVDAAVVLLGDVPRITPALIDVVVARQRETRAAAVVSRWNGRATPPVLLAREIWPAALALEGDIGMRDFLAARENVSALEIGPELGELDDVDTVADHARLTGP